MITNAVLGTHDQSKTQSDEYMVYSPNRIHDSSIENVQVNIEEAPRVGFRNDIRGRANIEL